MLENEVRDRLATFAVKEIVATDAAWVSIRMVTMIELRLGFHQYLTAAVLTQVSAVSCGESSGKPSIQSGWQSRGNS